MATVRGGGVPGLEALLPPNEREDEAFLGPTAEATELKYRERFVAERSLGLKRINLVGGLILLGTAVLVILLHYETNSTGVSFDVYTAFPGILADGELEAPDPHVVWHMPIAVVSGVTLLLGAIYHLLVALPLRPQYERLISRNQVPFRWVELAFTIPLLRVQLAVLCGIGDIHILWGLFGLAHAAMLLALLFERENGDRRNRGRRVTWVALVMAFVPQLFSWATVLCYFAHGVAHGGRPATIWAALLVSMLAEILAAANVVMQWLAYNDFLKGEVMWIVLSFVYRQLFTWLAFGAKTT